MNPRAEHRTAIWLLVLANLFWGLSFPLIKAIVPTVAALVPDAGNWFIAAMCLAPRFLLATLALAVLARAQLRGLTAGELRQGLVMGVALALGLLFQNDGLQFTSASTSAFLTQFYAIMIPAWVALRARRWPGGRIWVCGALVLAGVAVLARFDPRTMHVGRGELETLLSSVFFMGQILMLEDRRYAANRPLPVTAVMFATQAVAFTLMSFLTAPAPADVIRPWASGPFLAFTGLLTLICTLGSFTLMVKWQPKITATEAGLLYCTEPLFTAVMALFLPAVFSAWAGVHYPNEVLTWHLLLGGGLITVANIVLQLKPPSRHPAA
ncbi:MAG TPA: EamA family transporter [Opitutaceae bacterium]|nr:EamA family transporter [Opitutaceae bacterium]